MYMYMYISHTTLVETVDVFPTSFRVDGQLVQVQVTKVLVGGLVERKNGGIVTHTHARTHEHAHTQRPTFRRGVDLDSMATVSRRDASPEKVATTGNLTICKENGHIPHTHTHTHVRTCTHTHTRIYMHMSVLEK